MDEGNDRATDLLERLTDMRCVPHGRWLRRSRVTMIRMDGGGSLISLGMELTPCSVVTRAQYKSTAVWVSPCEPHAPGHPFRL